MAPFDFQKFEKVDRTNSQQGCQSKDEYLYNINELQLVAISETFFSGLLPHPTSVVFTLGATLEAPALELGTTTLEEWEVTILIALKLVPMFMPQGN